MNESPPRLFCANHPNVETSLRCNHCNKPICPKCAIRTPTGYRCRECVRTQQKVYNTAQWFDYPLAAVIAVVLSFTGGFIVSFVSFFIIFIAPIVAVIIAEVIRFVVHKRRSKSLFTIAAAGAAIGCLPHLLPLILGLVAGSRFGILGLVWYGVYAFIVTSTVYYRLQGINIR